MSKNKHQSWLDARKFNPQTDSLARKALEEIRAGEEVFSAIRHNPLPNGKGFLGKYSLVAVYRQGIIDGEWEADPELLSRIRLKPTRTLSGVTTVTVLTKPYPCPGKCIFCPTDERMPKSYLPDEPGAMRALHHEFEPFEQVSARLEALHAVGHPTDKVELLILGGTWSSYRRDYQRWFLLQCFNALNGIESKTLEMAHKINETTSHRNVGLVIETRPDHINVLELSWLRELGVTKLQIGVQSLDDQILEKNKRGHRSADTRRAVALSRSAGFKIVLHWMPNLLGASLKSDREDFLKLWDRISPDEIKIYPTQLLRDTELYQHWKNGEYQPYSTEELIQLLTDIKLSIPRYCRVNRVIRDIPSTNVVEGNKRTSLRQDIHLELKRRGQNCECIRCREIRTDNVHPSNLRLDDLVYHPPDAEEHFLSFVTEDDKLAGFLRLSLPSTDAIRTGFDDLVNAAIIREVHVYGQSLQVGEEQSGAAQHVGLGSRLIDLAEKIAMDKGFSRLAVIAAVGTRHYYLNRGFKRSSLYLTKEL